MQSKYTEVSLLVCTNTLSQFFQLQFSSSFWAFSQNGDRIRQVKINEEDIKAKSSEKYTSVKIGCLKVLDSYRFLYVTLEKFLQP